MTDKLIFNHHSLPYQHSEQAEKAIPDFLKICLKAQTVGISTILVDENIDQSWFRLQIAPNYVFQDWYNKHKEGSNRDIVRAFRAIKTHAPFFNILDIKNGVDYFEVHYCSVSYSAITAAAWHRSPLISFNNPNSLWCENFFTVRIKKFDEINNELLEEESKLINHYCTEKFDQYLREHKKERENNIQNGKSIIENAKEYYPFIAFCGKSKEQLLKWSAGTAIFDQVKKSLFELNSFSEKWNNGEFSFYSHNNIKDSGLPYKVSGESDNVCNTPSLKKERMFHLPNGEIIFFENHIKITNGYRLHFYANNTDKKIYVAYIGPHLKLK